MDRVKNGFATFDPGLLFPTGMKGEVKWSKNGQLIPQHRSPRSYRDEVESTCTMARTDAEKFAELIIVNGESAYKGTADERFTTKTAFREMDELLAMERAGTEALLVQVEVMKDRAESMGRETPWLVQARERVL